jgi:hypothetical protein
MTKEEFYNEFKEWTKEEMLSRAYDICLKNIELEARIEKAVEYIKENAKYQKATINNNKYYSEYLINQVLDILNGDK